MRSQTLILLVCILCLLGVSTAYRVSHAAVLDMEAEPNTNSGAPAASPAATQPLAAAPPAKPVAPASGNLNVPAKAAKPAVNATKPVAKKPTFNTTKPVAKKPVANATKPVAKKSVANATKPVVKKPVANASKPTPPANATKPRPPTNATKKGNATKKVNRTTAFKAKRAVNSTKPKGNNTKKANATKASNVTKVKANATKTVKKQLSDVVAKGVSLRTIKASNIATVLAQNNKTRGPTANCPTCQHMRGRPKVEYAKIPSGITLTAGPVENRIEIDESFMRQVVITNTGDKLGRYAMGLSKMFITNTTDLVNGEVEAAKQFKTLDFKAKGRNAPYKWEVSDPTNKFDNSTNMYKFQVVGTPKNKAPGTLRPTVILDEMLLSNENITTSKFDFKINNFDTAYWNVPVNTTTNGTTTVVNSPATHLAVVYTIQEITQAGEARNPKPEAVRDTTPHMNVTVPLVPVEGRDFSGEEVLDVMGVSVGGLDISGPGYSVTGAGNKKNVVMKVGKDADGQTAIYFFYQRFNTSMVHDPYVGPNKNILDNSAGVATTVMAVVATIAALCALF